MFSLFSVIDVHFGEIKHASLMKHSLRMDFCQVMSSIVQTMIKKKIKCLFSCFRLKFKRNTLTKAMALKNHITLIHWDRVKILTME